MISGTKLRVPIGRTDHLQGPKAAPLVIVEYGDFECAACGWAFFELKNLKKKMNRNLQLVFRHFPITSVHYDAINAAKAAEAAGLQGKFWKMHDILFENQDSLDEESLLSFAANLDLDLFKFVEDMSSQLVERKILTDLFGGAKNGIDRTPTFFINGFRYETEALHQKHPL